MSRPAPHPRTPQDPAEPPAVPVDPAIRLVPAPVSVSPSPGVRFALTPATVIEVTGDEAVAAVGAYLADLLRRPTGWALPVTRAGGDDHRPGVIRLLLDGDDGHGAESDPGGTGAGDGGPEGYRLAVTATAVTISAGGPAGLFHGVQTLRQLLPAAIEEESVCTGPWTVPGCLIVDRPRYPYRGVMLDVARHFFPVEEVRRFVDEICRFKINHLHLHLTDDQGWRIAIGSWPRLAEVGGATQVGGGPGGWWTIEQYRDLVAYAAARHVTVVPEIDLPGHTNAALTAYPELAAPGITVTPYTGTDVGFSALDTASEATYRFVGDVVAEVAAATPGPYLHIGGDEVFKLPVAEYLAFVDRAQAIVAANGKRVVGWHQIAPAGHVEGRVIQYWHAGRTEPAVSDAVRRGARLLLSPGDRCYLDMKYADDTPIGHNWAGLIEVRDCYDWDPAGHLADVPESAVLGVEAPLWTESVRSLSDAEFLVFPRLAAIAEVGWSTPAVRDWAGFRDRLAAQGPRWDAAGVTYHRSPQVPWPATGTPVSSVPVSAVPAPEPPTPRAAADDLVLD
ncbi:MAG TPA: beta-N-acetylhexosaminidase [Micromonospora sp.]